MICCQTAGKQSQVEGRGQHHRWRRAIEVVEGDSVKGGQCRGELTKDRKKSGWNWRFTFINPTQMYKYISASFFILKITGVTYLSLSPQNGWPAQVLLYFVSTEKNLQHNYIFEVKIEMSFQQRLPLNSGSQLGPGHHLLSLSRLAAHYAQEKNFFLHCTVQATSTQYPWY